ncbi:glycerophosphodiester phosphodiesterase family protein [Gordonia soli]|uniref:Putative esterase n=1 Tax=Gordonia soli NBRC 108243 TaxID=1223545 RepID=M0QHA1_9ACTN|nr:glycerophosphodiester phosphodiesterase family protein [Gordonia soli]GAC67696.1 putative esterase [Gordonia soli NBRC 108243]
MIRTSRRRQLVGVLLAALAAATLTAVPASAAPTAPGAAPARGAFDLQSHRGGRGEHTEESLAGFERSLRLGVSTLELDIVLTRDLTPIVWHDATIQADKCRDTRPVTPGDRQFPYVGKVVHDLSYAQISTLRCDKKLADFPDAQPIVDNRIARLRDLFDLTRRLGARSIGYNIETKIEAEKRSQSASPEEYVGVIVATIRAAAAAQGAPIRATIQSFDWRTLPIAAQLAPDLPRVALWDETTWKPGSRWLGPVSYAGVKGDVIAGARQVATVLSPGYSVPYGQTTSDPGFRLIADRAFVDRAHRLGLKVIPWTVNDPATMNAQIEAGVDGIITDYPTRLRAVMRDRGMPLPAPIR